MMTKEEMRDKAIAMALNFLNDNRVQDQAFLDAIEEAERTPRTWIVSFSNKKAAWMDPDLTFIEVDVENGEVRFFAAL